MDGNTLATLDEIEANGFIEASRLARNLYKGMLHIADGGFAVDLPADRDEIPQEAVDFIHSQRESEGFQ